MAKEPSRSEHAQTEAAALKVIKSVLDRANIENESLGVERGFRVTLREDDEETTGLAQLYHEGRVFMFRIVFPEPVPARRREDVSEFVMRANDGMFAGNFELNLDNGELKFKTYVDYRGTKLEGVYVRNAVLSAMEMVAGYAEALEAVIEKRIAVKAAIASVEE